MPFVLCPPPLAISIHVAGLVVWRPIERESVLMTATSIFNFADETTASLVLLAQQDNREAFGELVERYESMVITVGLKRLGDYNEAQELAQEVFVRAMQRLHQLNEPAAFGGWLRQITVRMAINRAVRRPPTIATEPSTMEATCMQENSPLDVLLVNERASQVHSGLSRLGSMDRDTLEAFYLRGQSLIEMSDQFDAPVGTIKRRLHVARKRLAAELETLQAV